MINLIRETIKKLIKEKLSKFESILARYMQRSIENHNENNVYLQQR